MNARTRAAQASYITHALRCVKCTAAARLPGAKRCRPGAQLWRDYLAALPESVRHDSDKRRAARRTALEISRRIP